MKILNVNINTLKYKVKILVFMLELVLGNEPIHLNTNLTITKVSHFYISTTK